MIKRRFTSVLIVSGLSPLFVWVWREFTGVQVSDRTSVRLYIHLLLSDASPVGPNLTLLLLSLIVCVCQTVPSLLALMGIRFEGLIPAIVLPLLLTMVGNTAHIMLMNMW